jgi:hypothetical protein
MQDELSEIAELWRWGASLAGAPDQPLTERWAAKAVIVHLAEEGSSVQTEVHDALLRKDQKRRTAILRKDGKCDAALKAMVPVELCAVSRASL